MTMTIFESEAKNYIRLGLIEADQFIIEKAKEFEMSVTEIAVYFEAPIQKTELLTIKVKKDD